MVPLVYESFAPAIGGHAAMDIGMTIRAASGIIPVTGIATGKTGIPVPGPGAGMPAHMAILAQGGCSLDQQFFMTTAVGDVAVAAVFLHWRVFPHEGPSFFSMALIAKVIQGIGREHVIGHGAVGIMAIPAGNLAFPNGVSGLFSGIDPDLQMATIAGFRRPINRLISFVCRMAIVAGEIPFGVESGIPQSDPTVGAVAIEALPVSLF